MIGGWIGGGGAASFAPDALPAAIAAFREPAYVVRDGAAGSVGIGVGGAFRPLTYTNGAAPGMACHPCLGILPPLYPEWPVSYTNLRAPRPQLDLVCRLLL